MCPVLAFRTNSFNPGTQECQKTEKTLEWSTILGLSDKTDSFEKREDSPKKRVKKENVPLFRHF